MKYEDTLQDIEEIAAQIKKGKLKELLLYEEVRNSIVENLHLETSIPKVLISWILSALLYLADKSGRAIGKKYLERLLFFVSKSPKLLELISMINEDLAQKADNNKILEYITKNTDKPLSAEYADHVSQILLEIYEKNKAILGEIRSSSELIQEALNTHLLSKPALEIKQIENSEGFNRFKYISDFIPFLGREKEFEFLDSFMSQNVNFSWQIIYGSGGIGKSRLALEYCKGLPQYWEKGFFYPNNMDQFKNWIPSYNTFIVIDNAGTRIDFVNELLEYLSSRSKDFLCPVRVLLLERDINIPHDWHDGILLGGEHGNLEDYRYVEPYHLQTLDKRPLAKIVKTFYESKDTDKKILKILETHDGEKRPLYAAILGAMLSHGAESIDNLAVPFIKDMHDRYWKKEDIDEEHYALVALATIVEKINFENVECVLFPDKDKLRGDWLTLILGEADEQGIYNGLMPHIIGEMFVLEFLRVNTFIVNKLGSKKSKEEKIKNFIEYCWKNYDREMASFSLRCLMDFNDHEITELLCSDQILIGLNYEDNLYLDRFPAYLMHLTYHLKSPEKAKERLSVLKSATEERDTIGLSQVYINACAQLIIDYTKTGNYSWVDDLYVDTLSLDIDRWPGSGIFTLKVNYILACADAEKMDKVYSAFKELKELLCEKVSLEQFNAFYRLFNLFYLTKKDMSSEDVAFVLDTHEKLQKVAEDIGRLEFQLVSFKATSNLLGFLMDHDNYDVAKELWDHTTRTIYDSKEVELYIIGANLAFNAIALYDDVSPLNFYMSGSLLRAFYAVHQVPDILIVLVDWIESYVKHNNETMKTRSEMSFYKKIREIPLNPKNLNKLFDLHTVEMKHLAEICNIEEALQSSNLESFTTLPGGRTIEDLNV